MCLETIYKNKPAPTGIGYKVFLRKDGQLFGQFSTGGRRMGRWLKSKYYRETNQAMEIAAYKPGFHVYVSRAAADRMVADRGYYPLVTKKVLYRRARLPHSP